MLDSSYNPGTYWDEKCETHGHTGTADDLLHKYYQLLQLKTVDGVLSRLGISLEELKILDAGCGVGDFVYHFAQRGARVTGIDISSQAIEKARERMGHNDNVTLFTQRIEEMDFPPDSFDLVTSIVTLQHIVEGEIFSRSMKRIVSVVKEGGYILVLERAPARAKERLPSPDTANRTRGEWIEVFSKEGCTLIYDRGLPRIGVGAVGKYRTCFLTLWSLISRIDVEKRRAIIDRRSNQKSPISRIYRLGESIVLALCYPFDNLIISSERLGLLRCMVFKKEKEVQGV